MDDDDDEEEEEAAAATDEEEEEAQATTEEEEDDDDDEAPASPDVLPARRRAAAARGGALFPHNVKPCPFGAKCYRVNPKHFSDESHPHDFLLTRIPDLASTSWNPQTANGPLYRFLSKNGVDCGRCDEFADLLGVVKTMFAPPSPAAKSPLAVD